LAKVDETNATLQLLFKKENTTLKVGFMKMSLRLK